LLKAPETGRFHEQAKKYFRLGIFLADRLSENIIAQCPGIYERLCMKTEVLVMLQTAQLL